MLTNLRLTDNSQMIEVTGRVLDRRELLYLGKQAYAALVIESSVSVIVFCFCLRAKGR